MLTSFKAPSKVYVTHPNEATVLKTIAACGSRNGEPIYFFADGRWQFVDQCQAIPAPSLEPIAILGLIIAGQYSVRLSQAPDGTFICSGCNGIQASLSLNLAANAVGRAIIFALKESGKIKD